MYAGIRCHIAMVKIRNWKMGLFTTVIFQFCLFLTEADAANILFLAFPSYSHIRGSLHVASLLGSRGHVVWNALPTELANDKRLHVPGVKILQYHSLDNYDLEEMFVNQQIEGYFQKGRVPTFTRFETFKKTCDLILRDDDLITNVKALKFDLIVYDGTPLASSLTIIAYKLDIPFIYMGAAFLPFSSRTPFVLSTFPFPVSPWTPNMDFGTRFINSIMVSFFWLYDPFSYFNSVALYAPEKAHITLESLTPKALLWLIDLEPLLHYPQATLPNVKFVGSLSASQSNPIPSNYLKFMNEAKDGVVIVSFGSNVKHIPDEISGKLFDAFSQTKYKFIFKSDKRIHKNPNVILAEWMPQSDLLGHPNVKLFITHCGANGQNEAFLNGVPMIGFPMFAEQHSNAGKLVNKGFGLKMDLNTFTVDELVANIHEIITNSSYSKKIKKAAEITKLRQRSPKEEAAYWIEHVLQYGGDHLRSYCQDMPLYQYLNLDVIGLLLFLLHLSVYLIWKLCCVCCKKIIRRSSGLKTKQE